MLSTFFRISLIATLSFCLIACAYHGLSPRVMSELQQGRRDFNAGYYKHAMHELLPLACDGNPEALYAVGYMYYYGYGVAEDPDVGYFWMKRAADKHYPPAQEAVGIINSQHLETLHANESGIRYKDSR